MRPFGSFFAGKVVRTPTVIFAGGVAAGKPLALGGTGAVSGDLLVFVCNGASNPSLNNGNALTGLAGTTMFWRRLTAGDAGASLIDGRGSAVAIYRGPSALIARATIGVSGDYNVAGFAKSAGHLGLLLTRNGDDGNPPLNTSPGSFTTRVFYYAYPSSGGGTAQAEIIADRCGPTLTPYQDNQRLIGHSAGQDVISEFIA